MLEALLLTGEIPEIRWEHGDDLCDCTFQRIGYWTNPYLARTTEIRICCVWKVMVEQNPEIAALVREIPAFDDYNKDRWVTEPAPWDSEDGDMPRALWHRQLCDLDDVLLAYGEACMKVRLLEAEVIRLQSLLTGQMGEDDVVGGDRGNKPK